ADGGYGAPPPPPPPAGPGAGSGWSLGDAINYGWTKFQANMSQILIAAIIFVVGIGVIAVVGFFIVGALMGSGDCTYDPNTFETDCDTGPGFILGTIIYALVIAILFVVGQLLAAGIIRGSLGITEGRPFRYEEIFKTDKLRDVVIASLIVAALTFVGFVLCYLPGIVVGFMTSYTLYFVLDKNLAPWEAVKASFNFTKDHLGDTIIWYIVGGLIAAVGIAICFVGGLFTVPIYLIGTAFTYKKLTGQQVAA
ncbi:MAG TPA: hypothetical protein PL137_11520, partial [Nocardioides sp.]|nr:hypothetical protein [Nocardioides sp.]